ncbi:hypothetical protein THASP1DRAFT_11306, partial [Thamnocephalis sphaerospora]
MQFLVRTADRTEVRLQANKGELVEKVRADVAKHFNTPTSRVRLILLGKQMEDGRTLLDYRLQQDDVILFLLR